MAELTKPMTAMIVLHFPVWGHLVSEHIPSILPGISFVGCFSFVQDIEREYLLLLPDLLIIDAMEKHYRGGLPLLETFARKYPNLKIIGVTSRLYTDIATGLRRIGAKGYINRDQGINAIADVIVRVCNGEIAI